jgi:hypothetical protein
MILLQLLLKSMSRIRIQILRTRMLLSLLDPDPNMLDRGPDPAPDLDPDPSIIKQKR